MFKQPVDWLKKNWWGLIVAHLLILVTVYLLIWQFAEPLGIPDNISNLPRFALSRVFLHLLLTLTLGAYVTLVLDLLLRRSIEKEKSAYIEKINQIKPKVIFGSEIAQHRRIKEPKTKFKIGEKIYIHATWFGCKPNQQYNCLVEIYKNTDFIHQFQTEFIPSDSTWITVFHYNTSENVNTLGTYRVHIYIDGVEKTIEKFYLYLPRVEGEVA